MQDAANIAVEVLAVIALLLNLFALHMLAHTYRKRVGSRKPYLIVLVLNIFETSFYALSAPRAVTHNYCIMYIGTGLVSSSTIGYLLLVFNFTAMLIYLLTILNSFLYFYILFCRPRYQFIYDSLWIIALGFANFAMIVNWLSGVVAQLIGAALTKEITHDMRKMIEKLSTTASYAKASIEKHSFMGFCNEDGNLVQYSMLVETSVTSFLLFVIALYFAHQVKKKLNEPAFSKRTKQMQRRLSNMLLAQALNLAVMLPVQLLLQPVCFIFGCTTSTSIVLIGLITISIFHVINPIITIISLRGTSSTGPQSAPTTSLFVLQTSVTNR